MSQSRVRNFHEIKPSSKLNLLFSSLANKAEFEFLVGQKLNLNLISSSLFFYHEKAAEALCVEQTQTHLGVAFVFKFSG